MSHLLEPCLASLVPSPAAETERGARRSACRTSSAAFDTLETTFFSEGDALSTAAAPGDAWDEATVNVRNTGHKLTAGLLGWSAAGLAVFGLCALAAWKLAGRNPSPPPAQAPAPVAALSPAPLPPATPAELSVPAPATVAAAAVPAEVEPGTSAEVDACQAAFARNRRKDVLSSCGRAFAANPQSTAIAVMLAKTEFDRGRFRPALDWARKAVALDESQADAYVFLGGAEQALGHTAAAKTAYQRYLTLAPRGRYAGDVRAVVASL